MKNFIVFRLAYVFVRMLYGTWRFIYVNPEVRDLAVSHSPKKSIVYACWHHSTLTSMLCVAFRRFAVLVSQSFDGEVIAYINSKFGVRSARGSSTRGGKDGLSALMALVEEGYEVGFTVDGPTGPRLKVKPGVVALASRSGVPIVPTATCGERFWAFTKSWDRFRLPMPFTKVYVVFGDPIWVSKDMSQEDFKSVQIQVEKELMKLEFKLRTFVHQKYLPRLELS